MRPECGSVNEKLLVHPSCTIRAYERTRETPHPAYADRIGRLELLMLASLSPLEQPALVNSSPLVNRPNRSGKHARIY